MNWSKDCIGNMSSQTFWTILGAVIGFIILMNSVALAQMSVGDENLQQHSDVKDKDLQRQIDKVDDQLDRIERKLDKYIFEGSTNP